MPTAWPAKTVGSIPILCLPRPLAQLGLARADSLKGDKEKALKAYEVFFALWKDAAQELPILRAARAEATEPE